MSASKRAFDLTENCSPRAAARGDESPNHFNAVLELARSNLRGPPPLAATSRCSIEAASMAELTTLPGSLRQPFVAAVSRTGRQHREHFRECATRFGEIDRELETKSGGFGVSDRSGLR